MTKRIVSFCVCFVLLAGFIGSYSAVAVEQKEKDIIVEPFWENAAVINLDMTFSNGTITSTGVVVGRAGTTAVSATFVLAQRNTNGTFTEVDRWTARNGNNATRLTTSRTTRNLSTGTYRLSVTASVVRNGSVEIVSGNHSATFR